MEVKCSHTDLIDIDLLQPNPRNPNKHPSEQIKLLAKIMKHQGWRSPIVVSNRSGFIVKGHGRLEAAKINKWSKVPVDKQDYATEADEWADMIADNKIAELADSDMAMINDLALDMPEDFDLELLGIPDFNPVDSEKLEPGIDEDEVPENAETRCKLGDVWTLGNHRLMCGDSTSIEAVEKLMNGEKADMVFTDPPYGIKEKTDRAFAARSRKAKGNSFSPIIGDDSVEVAKEVCALILSMNFRTIVIWGANYFCHALPEQGNWFVWDKREEEKERDFNSDCEIAWVKHPNRPSVRIFRHKWKGMIKASEHGQARVHPTQKPIMLAEWSFNEFDSQSKSVLDLFGGSGSTLIACEKTNRKCFMMEIDPHYCDVIINRWEKYSNKKAVLNG